MSWSSPAADTRGVPGLPSKEPERIVASLRRHGRAMFWPSMLLLAVSFAVAYLTGRFSEPWQNWAIAAGGALLVLLFWLLPLLRWLSCRYVITTRRIVVSGGLFMRTRQEMLHSRAFDVTVRQGALQRLVKSGDVLINTGLDRPVVLADTPAAQLVQSTLHDLAERDRGQNR